MVRLELEARFGGLFNDALIAAFTEFGKAGEAFAVNFDRSEDQPQNFYRENRSIDSLLVNDEPDLPGMAMWIGPGRNESRDKPRLFSGQVSVSWKAYLYVAGVDKSGLLTQREAIESALLATLDPEFPEFGFNGDLGWSDPLETQFFSQDNRHIGWAQEIEFTGTFTVNL